MATATARHYATVNPCTCPQSALALEDVFRDAGVPVGGFAG